MLNRAISVVAGALLWLVVNPSYSAVITVDTVEDMSPSVTDGKCSLREAIEASVTNSAVDTCPAGRVAAVGSDEIVFFIATPATIKLVDSILVTEGLIVTGLGPDNLIIDGDNQFQHFYFNDPATGTRVFTIRHITLKNGFAELGGSVRLQRGQRLTVDNVVFDSNTASNGGGAIFVDNEQAIGEITMLTISRSSFVNNESQGPSSGGAVRSGIGSVLGITESTFSNNRQTHVNGWGGAIHVQSLTTNTSFANISLSTFNGNSAFVNGGAMSIGLQASLVLEHSTVVGNTADADASDTGDGGGVYLASNSAVNMDNNIIATNIDLSTSSTVAPDLAGASSSTIISHGYNIIGSNEAGALANPQPGQPPERDDYVGTSAAPIDPLLDALADNGGPTQTMAISSIVVSPALDTGKCDGVQTDQRQFGNTLTGFRIFDFGGILPSPGGDDCDIGAFERGTTDFATDHDFDSIADNSDTCPNHFDPDQALVCQLQPPPEPGIAEFCLPIATQSGNLAVVCL